MILASSQAVTKDIGLIAVFGGIGLLVNIILVYVAIQIRGERRENQEYMASRRPANGA
jgi:ABC-type transporter Mla subunit MlaD